MCVERPERILLPWRRRRVVRGEARLQGTQLIMAVHDEHDMIAAIGWILRIEPGATVQLTQRE